MLVDIDAPGFRLIERDNGESDVYWYAAKRAIDAGYLPRTVRLFGNLNDPGSAIARRVRELRTTALRADLRLDPGVRYHGL